MVRPSRPEDRRFIVPTWVKSFADYAPWGRAATLAKHWGVVDAIMDDPATRAVVLATDAAARTLHAYAVGSGDGCLHYVYVPPELRGHGLARRAITALLGAYPATITTSHPWPFDTTRFRWNPYALPCAALERAA